MPFYFSKTFGTILMDSLTHFMPIFPYFNLAQYTAAAIMENTVVVLHYIDVCVTAIGDGGKA